ncbi:MAG: hypothetical protein IKG21_13410 [Atopobiaceae bacterium]|nr:hypothetical protein [Atopobiaceae bacterium]
MAHKPRIRRYDIAKGIAIIPMVVTRTLGVNRIMCILTAILGSWFVFLLSCLAP